MGPSLQVLHGIDHRLFLHYLQYIQGMYLNGSKFFNIGAISYQASVIYIYSSSDQNTLIRISREAFNIKRGDFFSGRGVILPKIQREEIE